MHARTHTHTHTYTDTTIQPQFATCTLDARCTYVYTCMYKHIPPHTIYTISDTTHVTNVVLQGHTSMETDLTLKHIYYGVLAIVVMLAGVILPLLFLFSYPVLPQVMAKCNSKLANRLNRFYTKRAVFHLLNIFQGHYRVKYYFYAGMWFIYCLVIYINDAFNLEYYTTRQQSITTET